MGSFDDLSPLPHLPMSESPMTFTRLQSMQRSSSYLHPAVAFNATCTMIQRCGLRAGTPGPCRPLLKVDFSLLLHLKSNDLKSKSKPSNMEPRTHLGVLGPPPPQEMVTSSIPVPRTPNPPQPLPLCSPSLPCSSHQVRGPSLIPDAKTSFPSAATPPLPASRCPT